MVSIPWIPGITAHYKKKSCLSTMIYLSLVYPVHLYYIIQSHTHSYICHYFISASLFIKGQGCSRRKIHNIIFNVLVRLQPCTHFLHLTSHLSLFCSFRMHILASILSSLVEAKDGWEKNLEFHNLIYTQHYWIFCGKESVEKTSQHGSQLHSSTS